MVIDAFFIAKQMENIYNICHTYQKNCVRDINNIFEIGGLVMATFPCINMIATGNNIKKIRTDNGLSVRDLQNYFGFDQPQAIYKWQWGECLPSIDNLYALSILFHISIDKILVGSNEDFFVIKFIA